LIDKVQVVRVPEHAPLQPENVEPAAGAAVNVTFAPWGKLAEHVVPQLMLAGTLVTVPEPLPAFATDTRCAVSVIFTT
jgi:hypothetical protein